MQINKNININMSTKGFNISENQDEITIEGYASKMYEGGKPVVDLDSEFVSTDGFELLAKRLLLNHDLDEPCGDITLEHKPDGIYLRGKAYKDTMSSKEWARLKKGLYSFSIGFTVEEAEYRIINGKDILTFTKGIVYEVSLTSTASNPKATIDNMKSISTDKGCVGLECSIEQIKSMNPNMDCSCLKDLKEETQNKGEEVKKEIKESTLKTIQDIIIEKVSKGLTIADTQNEPWHIDDNLWQMFRYFIETIEDNIYEFKWSESFDKDEMIENINSAMETFKQTVEIETTRINEVKEKSIKKGEQKNMGKETETKEVQESVQEETIAKEPEKEVESNKTTETEDSKTESKEEVISKESVTEVQEEEPNQDNQEDLAKTSEETPSKTEPQEPSKEEVKPQTPIKVSILDLNLEKASPDEIKEAYDTLAEKMDEIENYVEAELSKD